MPLVGWNVVRLDTKIIYIYDISLFKLCTYDRLTLKSKMIAGIRMGWGRGGTNFSSICARVAWLGMRLRLDVCGVG